MSRASERAQRITTILDAALHCFDQRGYEGTSLNDIRDGAGASIGSIYHHFGSKAAIAATLYQNGLASQHDGFLIHLRAATTAEQLIKESVRFHIEWAMEHPSWARFLIFNRRVEAVASIERELRADSVAFLADARTITTPYIDRNEIRRMPADLFFAQLTGPAQELIRISLSGTASVDLAEAREPLAEAAWRALCGESSSN